MRTAASWLLPGLALIAVPASAQEVFGGVLAHGVDTPFTFDTDEGGVDLQLGYRFGRISALGFMGAPAPYVISSVHTGGETSFVGAGLSWTVGKGPVYLRPGIGLIVHDGPKLRINAQRVHTELGSRVLFEPELGLGYRISERFSLEVQWTHISHARLFNARQNPGIDMIGLRANWRVR